MTNNDITTHDDVTTHDAQVQKEMISGLPEILSDDRHEAACALLLDHISTLDLVPCILEALSELTLSNKMLGKGYFLSLSHKGSYYVSSNFMFYPPSRLVNLILLLCYHPVLTFLLVS